MKKNSYRGSLIPVGNRTRPPGAAAQSQGCSDPATDTFLGYMSNLDAKQLGDQLSSYKMEWASCWSNYDALSPMNLSKLVVLLAKLPFASNVLPPPLQPCTEAIQKLVRLPSSSHQETIGKIEIALNAINRLLQFTWNADKEDVLSAICGIADAASPQLKLSNTEERKLSQKLNSCLEEIEKPWAIKLSKRCTGKEDLTTVEPLSWESQWKRATVGWLSNLDTFCPVRLPKMSIPTDKSQGVYESVEQYFDTLQRLWIAVTFCDGCYVLNPRCHDHNADKECCNPLWPCSVGDLKCRTHRLLPPFCFSVIITSRCLKHVTVACCNKRHHSALCQDCLQTYKKCLRGAPGQNASTHVYDVTVMKYDFEGKVFLNQCRSR